MIGVATGLHTPCPCCSPFARSLSAGLSTPAPLPPPPPPHAAGGGLLPSALFGYAAAAAAAAAIVDPATPSSSSVAELRRRARAHLQALAMECAVTRPLPPPSTTISDVTTWLRCQSSADNDGSKQ